MNAYEQRQAEKKQRLEERASAVTTKAERLYQKAKSMASSIPFGQPVLIGHHSEKRDRNFRDGINTTYGKAFAMYDKAEHYADKAARIGTGGISSDDPEAIKKLKAQLENAKSSHESMKKANALIRKHKGNEAAQVAAIAALDGFTEESAREAVKPDFCGRVGFPSYALSNNNANIHRIEQRIKELERNQSRESVEVKAEGYTFREDTEENRVMFIFEGKPADPVREVLKRHAFKWSPSRGAWVRQLTASGIYAAKQVRQALDALAA